MLASQVVGATSPSVATLPGRHSRRLFSASPPRSSASASLCTRSTCIPSPASICPLASSSTAFSWRSARAMATANCSSPSFSPGVKSDSSISRPSSEVRGTGVRFDVPPSCRDSGRAPICLKAASIRVSDRPTALIGSRRQAVCIFSSSIKTSTTRPSCFETPSWSSNSAESRRAELAASAFGARAACRTSASRSKRMRAWVPLGHE
mmetsp:Transcript_21655/g.65744  ORF Transcript_21655/g.65744 Transcript_21655/m.65744 type:complete len:207 (-) Transcript_21655:568-1188(-)|eukprot:scaffold215790_cov29-Tisochrysis_lutea.AAC.3